MPDMPTAAQVRAAVESHGRHWNERNREEWMALFAPDVTFDDPVGVPTKQGRAAVEGRGTARSPSGGPPWQAVRSYFAVLLAWGRPRRTNKPSPMDEG